MPATVTRPPHVTTIIHTSLSPNKQQYQKIFQKFPKSPEIKPNKYYYQVTKLYKNSKKRYNLLIMEKLSEICTENCPIFGEMCPLGSPENLPCEIKQEHYHMVTAYIAETFPTISGNNLAKLNAQVFLHPLYRQLLNLYIEEYRTSNAMTTSRGRINPVLKEIRNTLKSLQEAIKFVQEQAEKQMLTLPSANPETEDLASKSYYDMLLTEGKTDRNKPTGIGI